MRLSVNAFIIAFLATIALVSTVHGASFENSFKSSIRNGLKNIKADHWSISGNNIIIRGNVHIPMGEFDVYADSAVVNTVSKDIDATGNIQIYRNITQSMSVTPEQLARLENQSNVKVEVTGITTGIFGEQQIQVKISHINGTIKTHVFSGNLETGYFKFDEVEFSLGTAVFRARSGERKPNGLITVKNAEVSSCNYLVSENAHYSIACKEAEITPYDTRQFGMDNAISTPGEYSIFASNCTVRIYGVPVLWLPVFYKPKDENLGLFQIQGGDDGDWGYYLLLSKKFQMLDYPATAVRVKTDIYQERGFGYGASVNSNTENSRTSIFAYSIYDIDQYYSTEVDEYNIKIPHQRYDFRISNLTHITPKLDFRGNFEIMSDEFINRDFFNDYYSANPQPVSFASLEQQFDLFSASVYFRPRVNDFFTAVEQLPTGRIDVPRQEIFDTNIYYQSETSLGYFKRKWSNYELCDSVLFSNKQAEYEAARLDTVHFLYYPINLDVINIVPRAGFRFTAYSNTSKRHVDDEDLSAMLVASDPGYQHLTGFATYDNDGGSKVRFAGEVGVEVNTKIYNSWQDIRSAFFRLDGLRHVIIPYANYTYIPEPSLDRQHIYYFDDIDRIDRQNFVRLGLINRLQTRSGDQIVNYFTMENYWDYHFQPQEGFDNIGSFCTKLTTTPFKGFSMSTFFSIALDTDDFYSSDDQKIYRNGRDAGHPGLYWSNLNRFSFYITYEPITDFIFKLGYNYQNRYRNQTAYSMGSTLADIESGSMFNKYYTTQTQELTFDATIPITSDRRTFLSYGIYYDFNAGFVREHSLSVIRKFHCFDVVAGVELETENDGGDKETDISFHITAQLTGLTGPAEQAQNVLLQTAQSQREKGGWF